MDTIQYKVTYKLSSKSPNQEVFKNTRKAAEILADNINNDLGGVAIITEEVIAIEDDMSIPLNELTWNEELK